MRRLLGLILLLSIVTGCGSTEFTFIWDPTGVQFVSGLVSIIRITTANDNGSQITVTIVTFLHQGTSNEVAFCGAVGDRFPLNRTVDAKFAPGPSCGTLLSVTAH